MTRQEKNELLMKCLSSRKNIEIERAYELADMAIHEQYPDDTFSVDEQMVFVDYRLIVIDYLLTKSEDSA